VDKYVKMKKNVEIELKSEYESNGECQLKWRISLPLYQKREKVLRYKKPVRRISSVKGGGCVTKWSNHDNQFPRNQQCGIKGRDQVRIPAHPRDNSMG